MKKGSRNNLAASIGSGLSAALPPALLLSANLFVFLPFTIYRGNVEEFVVSFTAVLSLLLIPAVGVLAVLSLVCILLPERPRRIWVSLLFSFGLLVWLQGNFLVWDYGQLDGTIIDWSKEQWRGLVDGSVWVAVIFFPVLFIKRFRRGAPAICMGIVCLQLIHLGYLSFKNPDLWQSRGGGAADESRATAEIFEFSSKQNVIHIILDSLQSDIFQEIIDEDPEHYYTALDGFTFFRETTGSFMTTFMSLPAILSGKTYGNDRPMREFFNSTLEGRTILNVSYERGYRVDGVHPYASFAKGSYTNKYVTHRPYGTTGYDYSHANAAHILDLVLFRAAPHLLKDEVYNRQRWLVQRLLNSNESKVFNHFSEKAFLYDMIENATANVEDPIYKYIHLVTPHGPYVVDSDCNYPGGTLDMSRENVVVLARCSLGYVMDLLEKLKSLGIYGNSLIVIHADHGHAMRVKMRNSRNPLDAHFPSLVGSALPLLLVKPPKSEGPLKVSDAQTMLTDIPDTISSQLNLGEGFGGRSVFDVEEGVTRTRRFNYHTWKDGDWSTEYLSLMIEYAVKGSVFDMDSWKRAAVYLSPEFDYSTDRIDFGTAKARPFQRHGWKRNKKKRSTVKAFRPRRGNTSSVFLSLPREDAVSLTVNAALNGRRDPVHMSVMVDDNGVGSVSVANVDDPMPYKFLVRPDAARHEVSVVEFVFSEEEGEGGALREAKGDGEYRLLFESISVDLVSR